VHGEARFVDGLLRRGSSVVDAGCGTGRVAAELARRGHRPTGVDLDVSMLAEARARHPGLTWVQGDLLDVPAAQVGASVDCVLLAGNVVVYLTPGTEAGVVARAASWLLPGGLLVAGFAADRHVSRADYRAWCDAAGLEPVTSSPGWQGGPDDGGPYTVQVHRRPAGPA
jgi:SAM-dependent methyltransferase